MNIQFEKNELPYVKMANYLQLTKDQIESCKLDMNIELYEKGQVIHTGSLIDEYVFFVIEGYILYKVLDDKNSEYIMIEKPNDLFPVRNLFQHQINNDEFIAMTEVKLVSIPKRIMEELCLENKDTFLLMYDILRIEEQECFKRNMALQNRSAERKVINTLRILARQVGISEGNKFIIKKTLTVTLLSEMSGVSREMTSRVISELKRKRILVKNRGIWKISKSL